MASQSGKVVSTKAIDSKHQQLWSVFTKKFRRISSAETNAAKSEDGMKKYIEYGTCKALSGTEDQTLNLPEGTRGNLNYIGDHGQGVVRVSFDGTSPKDDNYPEFNARHTLNLQNVDLSKLVFNGSSTKSDYTVCYEVYKA